MLGLFILIAIAFLIFALFTAAQLIGFVFAVIGWILTGVLTLLGWILGGSWVLLKVGLVLAGFVFFGFFKIIGLVALVLLVLLVLGMLRKPLDRQAPSRSYAADDPLDRLRRDLDRMRRRMDNLETILGRD